MFCPKCGAQADDNSSFCPKCGESFIKFANPTTEPVSVKQPDTVQQYDEPQYNQLQYNQPQYNQPQYNQPQYNQPQYNQPQNNQPQYNQPQYNQPQYNQPQYNQLQYNQPQYNQPGNNFAPQNDVCCPNCGNTNLQVVNETDIKSKGGGFSGTKGCLGYLMFGPLGLLCGSCGNKQKVTSTNTTMFVCPKCGERFERKQDLEEKLKKLTINLWGIIIKDVISDILFIILIIVMNNSGEDEFVLFFTISFIVILLIEIPINVVSFINRNKVKKQLERIEEARRRFLR